MRALVLDKSLYFDNNYPEPEPQSNKVLIEVKKAGICNTDLELVRGYKGNKEALVLGHEFVGITAKGQRVVAEISISCSNCEFCRKGISTQCSNRLTLEQSPMMAYLLIKLFCHQKICIHYQIVSVMSKPFLSSRLLLAYRPCIKLIFHLISVWY
jgi:threonine dehydrogenase-like Zn-dependent dehydrogenase